MAFSYSGDPAANDVDYLRFIIGDTVDNKPLLQDEELRYIISTTVGNKRVAATFRQAATIYGARPAKKSLGPQSEDATERLHYFNAMADKYEKLSGYSAVPPIAGYQSELMFEKGMMANEV